MRPQLLGDLLARAHQVRGEHHPARTLRGAGARKAFGGIGAVALRLVGRRRVGGDHDQALRGAGAARGTEGADLCGLDRGEVRLLVGAGEEDAGGEQVQAVLPGPDGGVEGPGAVPEPLSQAGGVGLDAGGVLLDHALLPLQLPHPLAGEQARETLHPGLGEVLDLGGVRVEGVLDGVVLHRGADADAGIDPAAGEHVDGREVLREAQRVLPAQRRHRGAQFDPGGALARRGHHRDRGGDPELQVAVAQPGAVETELLAELDERQGRLVPDRGIGRIEQADREEAEAAQGTGAIGHRGAFRSRTHWGAVRSS